MEIINYFNKILVLILFFLMSFIYKKTYSQKNENDTLKKEILKEVIVISSITKTAHISKIGINEMDLPQAISVLSNKILQQQQIANLTDVLKNINGVYIMGNTGGYQEEIASRGSNITTTNTFKNGIRFFGGMNIETSGVESIEILKGNTAIEYGNVAPGGVLNIITKKPNFDYGGNINFTYSSFNNYKPSIDFFGTLNKNKTIAYRLNSSYKQSNSFRDFVNSKTYYLNPSLLFKLSKNSIILIEGDFTKSNTTPDFGVGIINYKIIPLPINKFMGVTWGKYDAIQYYTSAKYAYNFSKDLNLSLLIGYRNYETSLFTNVRPNQANSIISTNGNWVRNI